MIRIMIVDDAMFMRRMYRNMLEGHEEIEVAAEAANGFEAIAKYEEFKPDVVLMDITMPGMTGIEAVEAILQLDKKARIIMASAMGQEAFVRKSVALGAKAFVVKPVMEQHLVSTIRSVAMA